MRISDERKQIIRCKMKFESTTTATHCGTPMPHDTSHRDNEERKKDARQIKCCKVKFKSLHNTSSERC